MTEQQWAQVKAQLPEGAEILRVYRAIEGDLRVITREPGKPFEVRYTIRWDGDTPHPELKP